MLKKFFNIITRLESAKCHFLRSWVFHVLFSKLPQKLYTNSYTHVKACELFVKSKFFLLFSFFVRVGWQPLAFKFLNISISPTNQTLMLLFINHDQYYLYIFICIILFVWFSHASWIFSVTRSKKECASGLLELHPHFCFTEIKNIVNSHS